MTKEEAIGHIKDVICENNTIKPNMVVFEQEKEALCMAIDALKAEPCDNLKAVKSIINREINLLEERIPSHCRYSAGPLG